MPTHRLLLTIAACWLHFLAAQCEVVVLDQENFDDLTATGSWLVEFYAPWCGHCKKLAPIFDAVSDEVENVVLGKVDCTQEKALQGRFGVRGFPTIKFIRDGEVRDYRGERTRKAFLKFIEKVSADPVPRIKRRKLKDHFREHAVTFVFVGQNAGPEYDLYHRIARKLQGSVSFIRSSNDKVAKEFRVSMPSVAVVTEGGDVPTFQGPWEESKLRAFVDANILPLVSNLSSENFADITSSDRLAVFAVTNPDSPATARYIAGVRQVAKSYRNKFVFANLDGIQFDKYVSQFGITPKHMPVLFVFDYENEQFYPPNAEFPVNTLQNVEKFLDAVHEGKIQARTLGAWWSPVRLMRALEKWLGQFSDMELIIGSVVVSVGSLGCCFWLFCTGPLDDEDSEEMQRVREAEERERIAKAGIEEDNEDEDAGSQDRKKNK